jgi:ubiquinol-cytochrome c reductase cytochrome c1 subunit
MMFKKFSIAALAALTLSAGGAMAAEGGEIHDVPFSFEGPFGKFDQNQLQRGLQIYTEVCAACHGMKYVPLRTLSDPGGPQLSEDQMRAYAAQNIEVFDPELDDTRPGKPTDHFPASSLENAPDLSLMAKKRAGFHGPYGTGMNQLFKGMGGPEYIAAILTGYEEAPDCAPEDFPGSYNVAFGPGGYPDECKIYEETKTEVVQPDGSVKIKVSKHEVGRMAPGSWIGMPQPLAGEDVEFADGHSNELHQEAEDVAAFLMWAAEPKMMARKHAGFVGVLLLTLLSVLLYLTNKRIWAPLKGKRHEAS